MESTSPFRVEKANIVQEFLKNKPIYSADKRIPRFSNEELENQWMAK